MANPVRYLAEVGMACENLWAQKMRTILTGLGIIFGVGAVIGMLAIGAGAREESLRFIEQLGVRNLLIESRPATSNQELQERRRSSPGLTERDVRILKSNVDALELISARRSMHPARVFPKPVQDLPELYGVRPAYAQIHHWILEEGAFFNEANDGASEAVCILGEKAKIALLGYDGGHGPVREDQRNVAARDRRSEGASELGLGDGPVGRSELHRLYSSEHLSVPLLRQWWQLQGRS